MRRFWCFIFDHRWVYYEAFHVGYHHGCKKFLVLERCSHCGKKRERVGYADDLQALEQAWKGEIGIG